MNISKREQRVLHLLARSGFIKHTHDGKDVVEVNCFNRDGHRLADCVLAIFQEAETARANLLVRRAALSHLAAGTQLRARAVGQ